MIPIFRKFRDLPNVAASALSTFDIPCRNNHHGLALNFISAVPAALTQAQIETDVSWVSITLTKKGGRTIKILDQMTPAEIFDLLNDYPEAAKSTYTNAGVMYIPFTRPGRIAVQDWQLSLGMADVDVYQVQVQFAAGLATAAVVEAIPKIDLDAIRPLGSHIEMRVLTMPNLSAGEETVDELPFGEAGTMMMGYHIELGSTPGVISNVASRLDDVDLYTDLDAAQNNFNMHQKGYTPNADYFHVPLDLDYMPINVGAAKSFIQKWTWATAPGSTHRIISELICDTAIQNKA